jgi:predicted nuclease with TOPRIM domain
MLEQLDQIERIEQKLNKLLGKIKHIQKENELLVKEMKVKQELISELKQKNEQLEIKLNLRIASNATQDEVSKVAMEKRLSEYIKEIDRCIALLGDQD